MTIRGSGLEFGQLTERKSRWVFGSLVSLVIGFLAFAGGTIMRDYSYHNYSVGGELLRDMYEWGIWVQDAGSIFVILGLVLYVAWRRRGA